MDRRRFLQITAGTSGLIVLGSAPWASLPKLAAASPRLNEMPDMDDYLARVDSGLDLIARWKPTADFPDFEGDRARMDDLAPKSLRTLYITGMLADLPREGQLHAGMQERVWNMMPEMDQATEGTEGYLKTRSERELDELQQTLRAHRTLGIDIFEALDGHAAVCGVSKERRLQTRVLFTDAAWRLRNQSPALLIDQTIQKAQRAAETDFRRESREDLIAARIGEGVFWAEQGRSDDTLTVAGTPHSDSVQYESLRRKRISRGARMMGFGLVLGGVSAGLTAAGATPFIFVASVGALILIIGLITILIGLATSSSARTPIKVKK